VAEKALKTLWLLHGVNLDMLGRRDPAIYGSMTLFELEAYVARHGEKHGFTVRSFQTNHEGEFIEKVHQLVLDGADAAILNPGAWTHYSYALHDALELVAAGASAVQVGTATFNDPAAPRRVLDELEAEVARHGFGRVADVVGIAHERLVRP